jgi:hypothetical protein
MSQHSTLDPHATGHPHPDTYQMDVSRWTTGRNVLMFAALASVIACLAGYFTNPARLFQSYLVAFAFTSVIGLGAMFFVQVQFLTGSAWSVTMRRIMENVMITLSIRYTIDARKRDDFERYARALGGIIPRCGGELVGYWLPTRFAGPTNAALALIDFPSLAAYEQYRERLAKDHDNIESVRRADESGCILVEDRAVLERV